MRKSVRSIVTVGIFLCLSGVLQAIPLLQEGFDDVSTLPGQGWSLQNKSAPAGATGWFQGDPGIFAANSGAGNSYIAANFLNAGFGGNISNWLLTPELNFVNQVNVTFDTRTETGPFVPDRLEVRLSLNGPSIDVGTTDFSTGDFSTTLLTVNPTLDPNGYPDIWTRLTVSFSVPTATSGRLAFRYAVPDTSINADYIGIDNLSVVATPEPATAVLFLFGGVALLWRRRKMAALAVAGVLGVTGAMAQPAKPAAVKAKPATAVAPAKKQAARPAPKPAAVEVSEGGMVAVVDPETRQVRQATPAEIGAAGGTRSVRLQEVPLVRQGPGNTVGVRLAGSLDVSAVVTKDASGRLHMECVTGGDEAARRHVQALQSKQEVSNEK
jgi:hypothetical protein